jgi:hypothetical protein
MELGGGRATPAPVAVVDLEDVNRRLRTIVWGIIGSPPCRYDKRRGMLVWSGSS